MEIQPEVKAQALEIMRQISTLRNEKEQAVHCSDFEVAASLLKVLDDEASRLRRLQLPPYVLNNILRGTIDQKQKTYPALDVLEVKPLPTGEATLEQWPKSLESPIHLALTTTPGSPAIHLRTLLEVDDVFSQYFQAFLPVLCAATVKQFNPEKLSQVLSSVFIEISRCTERRQPVVLSVLNPTEFLDVDLQSKLVRGLKNVRCDFVIFANRSVVESFSNALLPEISLRTAG
jgi:hypothetical protein